MGRSRRPQPQIKRVVRVVPGDRRVVRNGAHNFASRPPNSLVGPFDVAKEPNGVRHVQPLHFPRVSVREPVVRHLDLVAFVADLLEKHAILVPNPIPPAGIVSGGERVHKARGKTTETAISEPRIALDLQNVLELVPKSQQRLFVVRLDAGVGERVLEVAPHEELQREIIHPLHIALREVLLRIIPRLQQPIAHRERGGLVRSLRVKVVPGASERVLHVVDNLPLNRFRLSRQVL
mmetsp:Transcript_3621/g.7935  ORF Transcript_3621/g.7935 Transcript_3621/m.7935 type:complete len:235 (-) Transcript_3621:185-889(-)